MISFTSVEYVLNSRGEGGNFFKQTNSTHTHRLFFFISLAPTLTAVKMVRFNNCQQILLFSIQLHNLDFSIIWISDVLNIY